MDFEKKDKIYNIVFLVSITVLLLVIWYVLTHSPGEYATKSELYVAIIGIMTGFSGMLWSVWSKLSEMNMKIGEICGKLSVSTKKRKSRRK